MRYRWSGFEFTIGYYYNRSLSDTSASQNIERMRTDGTERETRLKYDLRTFPVDIKKTTVKHSFVVGRSRNREMPREKRRDTFKRFRFNFTKYHILVIITIHYYMVAFFQCSIFCFSCLGYLFI